LGLLTPVKPLALRGRHDCFISRSSSGWVEGLNNKVKVLKRRSYGIKNLGNLFRRIWLDLRGYEAFAP
jgi:transposase